MALSGSQHLPAVLRATQLLASCPQLSRFASGTPSDTTDFGFKEVPEDAKERLVGQVFSNVAPSYDVMNDIMSGGLHRIWKNHFVSKLAPAPGIRHLDVAGGTGDIAFRILRALQQESQVRGHVTVLDINAEMIAQGKEKADKLCLSGDHLEWLVDSAESLPLENESVDSYTIAFGIRNVTNRDKALQEAHRVLRKGGRFMCLEFSKVAVPVFREIYDTYSMNVIPKMGKFVANDEESYRYLVESIRRFPDAVAFADMIQDAGFCFVDYEMLTGGIVAIHSGHKL